MDIYLCSTIRHLLFALLKGLSKSEKKHIIFIICDQQSLDENNFDKTKLPENIKVICIKREMLRSNLYKGFKGKCLKLSANFNLPFTTDLQRKVGRKIFNQIYGLSLTEHQLASSQLYLFNDRNKISRLFRLAFSTYNLLEEGLANYSGIKLKKLESIYSFFKTNKNKMRYFGDDNRCEHIYLISPEQAPSEIRFKVCQIDFIRADNINKYCLPFFKVLHEESYDLILATQPLKHTGIDLEIYKKIVKKSSDYNISIAIKPHPREDIERYRQELPNTPLIESKLPLELIIFGYTKKTPIISLYSTVGIGFEKYCSRYNIIEDENSSQERIRELTSQWQFNIDSIDKRIDELLNAIVINH